MSSADASFRWLEDITIELKRARPNAELKLVIVADIKKEYNIKKAEEIRTNERIPCQKAGSVTVELYIVKRYKKNERILLIAIPSGDESCQTDTNNMATVQPKFVYTRGGNLREQVENSRQITNEQQAILDKIERVRRFFESLQGICNSVKEVHQYVEAAFSALLLLYNLCEKQKKCRDAARSLVDEMDDLLSYGVEQFSDLLKENSNTRAAFKSISQVIIEASKYLAANDKRGLFVTFIRDAVSPSNEKKLEELRNKLKRAIGGLKDSVTFGTWEITVDHVLERRLKAVSTAHYQSGARCLMNTRTHILEIVNVWARDPSQEKVTWVYGYAGSGKSALYNSIAENLEKAGIPFTCFTCKRDDPELSDVQRVLPTLAYAFTQIYDDYRGIISNLAKQPAGLSIATGDVRKQIELLFGKCPDYELINSTKSRRPAVHVILIDALDECRDVRERVALAKFLRDLADAVPWIKVLITSRRVPDIVKVLGDASYNAKRIDINDDEWDTNTDIRRFIQHRSDELEIGLLPNQVDRLQEMAAGLFVWCSTVFRYFEGSRKGKRSLIKEILDSPSLSKVKTNPFSSLYSLYQRVLDSAVSDEDDKSTMESILSVIYVAASNQPLSSSAIADILYPNERCEELEERREWVENLTKSLFAILYVEEGTNVVRTCHPSVLDFTGEKLTPDKTRGMIDPFSIGLEETHVRVFDGCLTIMDRDLRFNICGLEDSFRLNKDVQDLPSRIARHISEALRYVSLFWACHLVQSNSKESSERVAEFLNSPKVLFWIEVLSLLGVVERGTLLLQDCSSFFTDKPEILEIAEEWERFLLAYGDAFQSTPHLYLSLSTWLPQSSRIQDIVSNLVSPDLPIVANTAKTWPAERWSEYVGSPVRCVTYSADGRHFAAGCEDGSMRLWKALSGKRARRPFMSGSDAYSISFSPDGRWLASGHGDGVVRVWALDEEDTWGIPRRLDGHSDTVSSVAFSSDGKQLVSGSWDETVLVWDVDAGTVAGVPFVGHAEMIDSVAFSADDKRIFSGSQQAVHIWNHGTDEATCVEGYRAQSIACSRDGRLMAFGALGVDLFRLGADTPSVEQLLKPGQNDVASSVSFSADSKHVAAGFLDHSICVWNSETFALVCALRGHTDAITSVAFAPYGQKILSGSSDGTVRVWNFQDTVSPQPLKSRPTPIKCVAYSPDGRRIASSSRSGEICLWDAYTGSGIGEPLQGHVDAVEALVFSRDGKWLISGSEDNSLRVWDALKGVISGEAMLGHENGILSVAVSPNSQLVASGSYDNTVRLWNLATREAEIVLRGHSDAVNTLAFSVDGTRIISGSYDDTICIWDIEARSIIGAPHSTPVRSIVVSSDGNWVAFSTYDTIRVWSLSPCIELHAACSQRSVISLAFSPDSNYVVSGTDNGEIRVWNVWTGEPVGGPLYGHTGPVKSIAYAPNGHEVVSSSGDGSIRVWYIEARTGLELYKYKDKDYFNLSEEELRICWNASCGRIDDSEGWVRDGGKLLMWVPVQYRRDVGCGLRTLIGSCKEDVIEPPRIDHSVLFRYSGRRWTDNYSY